MVLGRHHVRREIYFIESLKKSQTECERVDRNAYDQGYFEGRNSNYWWTVGKYENLSQFPHWQKIVKLVQEFRDGGRFLDVGCAYGLLVNEASKHFESYGVDVSRFAVQKSKKYCKGNISRASAVNLPFQDESFDAIALVDTLEHIPDYSGCLRDVVRILKKSGILLLQLPNPLIWAHVCARVGLADETHMNNFGLEQWRSVLLESGVKVEKWFGFVAYGFKKLRFFAKSRRAASLFPELWIIARK